MWTWEVRACWGMWHWSPSPLGLKMRCNLRLFETTDHWPYSFRLPLPTHTPTRPPPPPVTAINSRTKPILLSWQKCNSPSWFQSGLWMQRVQSRAAEFARPNPGAAAAPYQTCCACFWGLQSGNMTSAFSRDHYSPLPPLRCRHTPSQRPPAFCITLNEPVWFEWMQVDSLEILLQHQTNLWVKSPEAQHKLCADRIWVFLTNDLYLLWRPSTCGNEKQP